MFVIDDISLIKMLKLQQSLSDIAELRVLYLKKERERENQNYRKYMKKLNF
jgi:hypothetical protein